MIKEIRLSNILVTSQIYQKISWIFCLSFKENNVLWHACMKYLNLISLHKLDVIYLKIAFWDLLIMKYKVCNLVKIKQQISQQLLDWTLIKSCQKIHINWTNLKTIYEDFVRIMFIINHFSDLIFFYFISMHEKNKKNLHILKNFVNWMSEKFDLKIKIIKSDNELAWKRILC